jgi:hypothetical protein
MLQHIRSHADELRQLLPTATLAEQRQLIDIFLEGCSLQKKSARSPTRFWRWLSWSGVAVGRITADQGTVRDLRQLPNSSRMRRRHVRLPPTRASPRTSVSPEGAGIDDASLSPVVRYFASMIKVGCPPIRGMGNRRESVTGRGLQLGQAYTAASQTIRLGRSWASQWTLGRLNAIGTFWIGPGDVAFALTGAPSL